MADRSLLLPISIMGIGAMFYLMKKDDGDEGYSDSIPDAEVFEAPDPNKVRQIASGEVGFSLNGDVMQESATWRIRTLDSFLDKRRREGLLATKEDLPTWWYTKILGDPSTALGQLFSGWWTDDPETQEVVGDVVYASLWLAATLGIGRMVFRRAIRSPKTLAPTIEITEITPSGVQRVGGAIPMGAEGATAHEVAMWEHQVMVKESALWDAGTEHSTSTASAGASTLQKWYAHIKDSGSKWGKEKISGLATKKGAASIAGLTAAGAALSYDSPNLAMSALDSYDAFLDKTHVYLGNDEVAISELPRRQRSWISTSKS